MFETICALSVCLTPTWEIKPQCQSLRTHPEMESLADCRNDNQQDRNRGVINRPNVCDQLNTAYMTTEQQAKYWQAFKCPLG